MALVVFWIIYKLKPLEPAKVKGFLFAYFLDFLITSISPTIAVASSTNFVINTITVTKVAMLGIICSYTENPDRFISRA